MGKTGMIIGLDFDNTIVRYDQLFHRLAVERGLIPDSLPATKQSVRDYLRAAGREREWTELQGLAYGPRIAEAEPFAGVKRFLALCRSAHIRVAVVSHKSRHPYRGEQYDLHAAAHAFLESKGFYETGDTGLAPESVYFEQSLPAKIGRIGELGCSAFVDDLPEVLAEPGFPPGVRKVLFDPANAHVGAAGLARVDSWIACAELLLAKWKVSA